VTGAKGASPERFSDCACALSYPVCELLLPPAHAARFAATITTASELMRIGSQKFKVVLERCAQQPISRLQSGIGSQSDYWMKFAFGMWRNETFRSITQRRAAN
jgi:hypothetical protein